MDDALPRLIDVEQLDAACRGFHPQRRQQLLPDLAGPGAAVRRGNGVIRGREGQFRTMDLEAPALDIEQPARTPEIVQKVPVDVQKIRIFAQASDDMLVPDLGQHRTAGLSQGQSSLRLLEAGGISR